MLLIESQIPVAKRLASWEETHGVKGREARGSRVGWRLSYKHSLKTKSEGSQAPRPGHEAARLPAHRWRDCFWHRMPSPTLPSPSQALQSPSHGVQLQIRVPNPLVRSTHSVLTPHTPRGFPDCNSNEQEPTANVLKYRVLCLILP